MKPRFLLVMGLVATVGLTVVFLAFRHANSYETRSSLTEEDILAAYQARAALLGFERPIETPRRVLSPGEPVRLAIGSLGLPEEARNRQLVDLVTARLSAAEGLELVERQAVEKVLGELSLTLSGFVRGGEAVRVGQLLPADWFLLGTPATLSGIESIVVRLVDARSGIMVDGRVFSRRDGEGALASSLAEFVRETRAAASDSRPRVYLALGAIQDLSVNKRHASFPAQLAGFLTSAYQNGSVVLLEREHANTLLREMHLDLAGLTSTQAGERPPMQAAYWLVSGSFQSFETTGSEVELALRVSQMFGLRTETLLRGTPGETLFQEVKATIDGEMSSSKAGMYPTRNSEIRAQLETGRKLAPVSAWMGGRLWYASVSGDGRADSIRASNEAIQAFETVLLLDRGNREAQWYLAACLADPLIGKVDEGRALFRSLVEGEEQDSWAGMARQSIQQTFSRDYENQLGWYEAAAASTANSGAAAFYREQAEIAREEIILRRLGTSEAMRLAEKRLVHDVQAWDAEMRGNSFRIGFQALGDFRASFGTNHAAAAERMIDLLPELQALVPDMAPHLLAGVVTFQAVIDDSLLARFEAELDEHIRRPELVLRPERYFQLISGPVFGWSVEQKRYELAIKLKLAMQQVSERKFAPPLRDPDWIALGFCHMALEQWDKALAVFEAMHGKAVAMGGKGLWGPAFTVVLTGKEADRCRAKLGVAPSPDPREFDMGKGLLSLNPVPAIATDDEGIWITAQGRLLHLGFNLQPNLDMRVPHGDWQAPSCMVVDGPHIWIGTPGEGLIQVDKARRTFRQWTEKDGLMMDHIRDIHLANGVLWLGYGDVHGGGLGFLDPATGRATSFARSLADKVDDGRQPTRQRVSSLIAGGDGAIWFMTGWNLRRYHPRHNTWEPISQFLALRDIVGNSEMLVAAVSYRVWTGFERPPDTIRIGILKFEEGDWRTANLGERLPSAEITAITLHEGDLWVGGMGFVAMLDPERVELRRVSYVPANSVDRLFVADGSIWALFNSRLHKAPLK